MKKVLALAAVLLAPVALAQEEKPSKPSEQTSAVDAAAQQIIEKSSAAIKGLKDVSCTVEQTGPMGDGGRGTMALTLVEETGGLPMGFYKAAIHDESGKATAEYAFDGKVLRKLDHGSKTLLSLEVKDETYMPPMEMWGIFPRWVFEERMPNPALRLTAAKVVGEETLGGVRCHVIEQVREAEMPRPDDEEDAPAKAGGGAAPKTVFTDKKWIGAEDFLPRKFESSISMIGLPEMGANEMKFTGTYTDIKANAAPTAEAFILVAPEGYASKAGTPEDLGVEAAGGGDSLKVKVGDAAPAFTLQDSGGKEYTLEGLKGRVVLLDFWATWCGPCKQAMPSVQRLHEKFADKPVSVMGVNVWEEQADAGPKYMAKKKFTYTGLLKGDKLAEAYGITGIPTLIVIGPDGKVLHTGVGFGGGEEENLAKLIEEQLAKLPK